MRHLPELPPREYDVPCVYNQTAVRRSASIQFDPWLLATFAATACSYALEVYSEKPEIVAYLKAEFARAFGKELEVETYFIFHGDHITLDVVLGAEVPAYISLEVQ